MQNRPHAHWTVVHLVSTSLVLCSFLFGLPGGLPAIPEAEAGTNTFRFCMDRCTRAENDATKACHKDQCAKLKSKAKRQRCTKSCARGEMRQSFCKKSCTKAEGCRKAKNYKTCVKSCRDEHGANVRKYLPCKKKCDASCPDFK